MGSAGYKIEHCSKICFDISVKQNTLAMDIALVAVFAALVTVMALTPAIPVGIGVPITLQNLAVLIAGLILGPWRGFAAVAIYLLLGFAGLPVFAGGASGLGMFAKPSIGYLLAFPLGALVAGLFAYLGINKDTKSRIISLVLGAVTSFVVIHLLGIIGLTINTKLDFIGALTKQDIIFWPGDIIKSVIAIIIAFYVHKAFPMLSRSGCCSKAS